MFKSLKRSAKGASVPHEKATAGMATVQMPVPEHVIIPMSMHIGAPAEPVVKMGDTVTIIGKDGDDEITSMELGEVGGTSSGHVCCAITSRPLRYYVNASSGD